MKMLRVAFWTIAVATGLRIFLCLAILAPWTVFSVLPVQVWNVSIRPVNELLYWVTAVYSLVIGYILWLFKEKKQIVRGSYIYLIGVFLYVLFLRHRMPEDHLSPLYTFHLIFVDIPFLLSGVSWFFVRVRPIAPYYWALGGIYVVCLLSAIVCRTLYLETQIHAWIRIVYVLAAIAPLPLLFLIARARRELRERKVIEEDVLAM